MEELLWTQNEDIYCTCRYLLGKLIYKEMLTLDKIIALIMWFSGCFLAVTGGSIGGLNINIIGVIIGIGAGFTYALGTILGKAILDKYNPLTISLYSFGFGLIPATLAYVLYYLVRRMGETKLWKIKPLRPNLTFKYFEEISKTLRESCDKYPVISFYLRKNYTSFLSKK
ncbi:hypothetical protein LGK97_02210 [Clostridium sp. CS001]|uniref:hypothetical protein n=1 Tax=Clostridium sp. CS001 TaxID=2880648 RepID=UPI001CF35D18|nr:hypothetical protein [Clostridium sp. CS001]MCB2288576.1 hypothetical protein [Clostridium sp. CS001]